MFKEETAVTVLKTVCAILLIVSAVFTLTVTKQKHFYNYEVGTVVCTGGAFKGTIISRHYTVSYNYYRFINHLGETVTIKEEYLHECGLHNKGEEV
jgi:uncharacterized membrane protein